MDVVRSFEDMITSECEDIKNMLLEKNRKYGNSALSPKRIFSKASTIEQIFVRIDDKLSRIQNMGVTEGGASAEDAVKDLIGYLLLLRIEMKKRETASAYSS